MLLTACKGCLFDSRMEPAKPRSDSKDENFKVGVRVRPPLSRESAGKKCIHLEHGGVTVFRGNMGLDLRGRTTAQALIDVTDLANLHQTDTRPQTYFYDSIFDVTSLQVCVNHM